MDRYTARRPLGPQIHAVPEKDRYFDPSSKKTLPWGYENINTDSEPRAREPVAKGAFGKSRGSRRGTSRSRSKTAEPRSVEDERRREQMLEEEKVFGSLRRVGRDGGSGEHGETQGQTQEVQSVLAAGKGATPAGVVAGDEATEVLLYGFGDDLQWSAIAFFESVTLGLGVVLEDYDRVPPYSRDYGRQQQPLKHSLSKAALRKKNKYAGGAHWIKVTFSSREAAELAMARSPHLVKGHMVYAELWAGRGPARDEPIVATAAGVQVTGPELPGSFSTNTVAAESPNGSQTISSRTAVGEEEERTPTQLRRGRQGLGGGGMPWSTATGTSTGAASSSFEPATPIVQQQRFDPRTSGGARLRGAQRATLLPAEQALMPRAPKASWSAWMGASEVIGSAVPRLQDGSFDYARASIYWRVWWWIDGILGTDFCGLKGDD